MSPHLAIPHRFSIPVEKACAVLCVALFLMAPAWAESQVKILYEFRPDKGYASFSALVFDSAGNLYGTTSQGGVIGCGARGHGCGTVFQLTPQPDGSWKWTVLYQFKGSPDGDSPYAGVILDSGGNLYGTTAVGGLVQEGGPGDGTIYELSPGPGGWTETILHTFGLQAGDGIFPEGPLTFDKSGNLYGTTYKALIPCGTGTVFQLSPNPQGAWTENQLYCFHGGQDGAYPGGGVIFDLAGNLYATTFLGGIHDDGTVFELSPSGGSWTENILYNLGGETGGGTSGSLVSDKSGNLYGTAYSFSAPYNVVFQLTPSGGGWTYTPIWVNNQGGPNSIAPISLIIDNAGNLYGTAGGGSSSNCRGGGCGAVFKLAHGTTGWHMTVLYNFPGGEGGASPYGGLVMDRQGNLYGTTFYGGLNDCEGGCGVVYEILHTPN